LAYHLYYFPPQKEKISMIVKSAKIPISNLFFISVKETVDQLIKKLKIKDKVRIGNLIANANDDSF
jgi:hypothetical protein